MSLKSYLMELFKWIEGRQYKTRYHKWCFLYCRIGRYGFDGYILRYQPLSVLPVHNDPIDGKHYRLNIKLSGIAIFKTEHPIIKWGNKLCLFRPDICLHSLFVLTKTYKLSLGFAKFNKHGT